MKTPVDMYNLALQNGYNLYYATAVFLAREKLDNPVPVVKRTRTTDLAKQLRSLYEVKL